VSLAVAELLEDRGEAAASEEFFRSREFLDAEGTTHTLRIVSDGDELFAPLIVCAVGDGPERDATSPYGYPGILPARGAAGIAHSGVGSTRASQLDPAKVDFSATGLVTLFLRHTLADPLAGASERNVVQIADPSLPAKSRPSDRNQVNKNLRRGYEVRITPGPETSAAERAGFLATYEQTMRRTGAAERYFFGASYFDRILESPASWLALALAPEKEIAAASVAVTSDGYLHYYLSGSGDSHLRDSPMKNVVASLVEMAAEHGLPLNLGGGISRGDRLEEFKRGFANREMPWRTSEIICDADAYARLSAGRAGTEFFPDYRAS
jgi:Acetyltransferase (GNAT) domain